ncbi:hypothetical protein GPECTOR_14g175 [Gonium pectorale]|uniref:Neurotransmitter-gated ion-channel transmembrane domain-containing protein n=1 Tax=Gonium pectorale TaxID=33097 RepID=A0A150GM46_GONPE|nr:hypothetical protein GPECTOR_14g175 [Gonium pectorale]|eukprot:KXZ50929.1 hypothetical protein GPECTOR_14g175 [Gonium pectorale]
MAIWGQAAAWLLLVFAAPAASAQRVYPLLGADGPLPVDPSTGTTQPFDIQTTVLLERVVHLDEQANGYGAIWWVILTWPDANAGAAVASSTAAFMRSGNCTRPCDSGGLASMGCCDGMWLPHIEVMNFIGYQEDQQPRWRINANSTSGTVTWSTRLVGNWYAPLDYRAYPFDHQHVLLEVAIHDSQAGFAALKWEHVAKLNNTAHTKGPDVSGWRMVWGKGKIYDSRKCLLAYNITAPRYDKAVRKLRLAYNPASDDAARSANDIPPALYESITMKSRHFPDNRDSGTTEPDDCGSYTRMYDEARALYGPVVLVADVMIKRVASYYVLTNLVPILLITLVAFVVFFMPQDALGDRMSVVLTMLLSLTAMQFVFDFPPANYLNALQMVVLVSYILIALACVESLVVNRIATVADAVAIKRNAFSKYGPLLTKAAFERYLHRELSPKTASRPSGGRAGSKTPNSVVRGGPRPTTALKRGTAAAPGGHHQQHQQQQHVTIVVDPAPAGGLAAPTHLPRVHSHNGTIRSHTDVPGGSGGTTAAVSRHALIANSTVGGSVYDDAASSVDGGVASHPEPHHPPGDGPSAGGDGPPAGGDGSGGGGADGPAVPPQPPAGPSRQFASGRTHVSWAVGDAAVAYSPHDDQDGRSIGSNHSRASTVATFVSGTRGVYRRCCALGFGPSLRAFFAAAAAWLAAVAAKPGAIYRQCGEDPRFARYVAARIDKWSCVVCVALYVLSISILLYVQVKAIWWAVFAWRDANAGRVVETSTTAAMQPGGSCSRLCDSGGLLSMGCCDGIWVPHIELPNLVAYDEDQLPRWRINANSTSGTVTWSTRLVGTWYAPLDYRAYPFDHQHLLLELAIHDSQAGVAGLKWQHVAKLNNTAHTKGPDFSGWRINWAKGKVYDSRVCYREYGVAEPSYTGVTAPNATSRYRSIRTADRYFPDNTELGTTLPSNCGEGASEVYDESLALYGPVVLVADIMIKRVASYYVLTNLLPVLLITLVAFVVFFMPQDALGDRMSVVLTMLLSLTAMQFVFDFPPANYLNALQLVVLVSYIMIVLVCIECLVVNRIVTVADAVSNKRSCVSKYGELLEGPPQRGTSGRVRFRPAAAAAVVRRNASLHSASSVTATATGAAASAPPGEGKAALQGQGSGRKGGGEETAFPARQDSAIEAQPEPSGEGTRRGCCTLGFRSSLRAFFVAVPAWAVAKVTAPSRYYQHCKEDPRFARFLAAQIDKWSCIVCVTLYLVTITALVIMEVKIGDHKLMLGETPGNL